MSPGISRPSKSLRVLSAIVGASALISGLSACSDSSELGQKHASEKFGYLLSRPLVTLNAGTSTGVVTDAEKASARLYPGPFIAGPDGQLLPNPDLVTAQPKAQDAKTVVYTINSRANYSDGAPVVCDDFLMAHVASSRSDLFGADMPLFSQVASVNCTPGAKTFTVVFKEKFGARYRELFTPGTVLPTHIVAEKAGVDDPVAVMYSGDDNQLSALGRSWQDTFNVTKTDPASVPTSGPYKVAKRGSDGELTLVANSNYAGGAPLQDPVVLWPGGSDVKQLVSQDQLAVADLTSATRAEDVGMSSPDFYIDNHTSGRVDTLLLDTEGLFTTVNNRRALALCIDRAVLVDTVKKDLNVDVTATGLRMLPSTHPLSQQLKSLSVENQKVNKRWSRGMLGGQSIRVGYLKDVPRYKTLVDGLKKSCADAGITIQAVPLSVDAFGAMGKDYDVLLDTRPSFGRDASTNESTLSHVASIRKLEQQLNSDMLTIPLTTEPRQIAVEAHVANVSDNAGDAGVSWNMDRWKEQAEPVNPRPGESTASPDANPNAV
ncbi:ABC transporter substrate-binding protein [Corynebacterium anserum]|uniref:Peptide ABC transporter n=1 Tax=Corynebacterium anserum TaxID=2684406 RepID=A0A7G7YNK1_9CORY|nr:ABC transporter substrate-binding protein [Corynebacterium anserum]QNH96071.1 peptide ABC transporter [Corynebacterium anserum]